MHLSSLSLLSAKRLKSEEKKTSLGFSRQVFSFIFKYLFVCFGFLLFPSGSAFDGNKKTLARPGRVGC